MVNEEAKTNVSPHETQALSPYMRKILLIISCIVLSIGNCGGPLIMRLYFIHGAERIWLSSWLLTAGWPLILIVLIPTFYHRRTTMDNSTTKLFNIKPRLILASAVIGILTGADNYLYSYGIVKLPVSTSALVIAL
ncbi:Purine permease 3 [Heracleum sosnowskyi]|uniref:Purine permease 3 n=1 Tax=Heracleum sosnowskyi TaxID=360622 RepID=A0AAD8HH22_9APIA|nr:Purine permease 3 [Heracleum sosnowskyi]